MTLRGLNLIKQGKVRDLYRTESAILMVASDRIAGVFRGTGAHFEHSFTMAGHPVACAAGLATMQRLTAGEMIDRLAADLSAHGGIRGPFRGGS